MANVEKCLFVTVFSKYVSNDMFIGIIYIDLFLFYAIGEYNFKILYKQTKRVFYHKA